MPGAWFLLVVSFSAALSMIGVGLIVALLPQRVLDLSGSLHDVGTLASAFALSYLLVQLPMGSLADRLGAKRFLVLGYALCCVSGLVFFSAETAQHLLLGRLIQGAGEAPIWALGPALLALAYPQAKGRVIGIYNAAIHAGLTLGPLLGLLLISSSHGDLPFILFSGLCFTSGVSVLLFLSPAPTRSDVPVGRTATTATLLGLLKTREPRLTLAGIFLYGAGYGVFVSVLPASLVQTKGHDAVSTGVLFALFYVGISLSQVIVGPLSDRHGRYPYMIGGLLMAATSFALLAPTPQPWSFAVIALASVGLGVFCVSSLAYLNDCVPGSLKGTISASYYLSWGLGYFLGPFGVSWLAGWLSPMAGYGVLAAMFALQSGILAANRRITGAGGSGKT